MTEYAFLTQRSPNALDHAQCYLLAHEARYANATSIPSINGGGTMAISDSSCPLPTMPSSWAQTSYHSMIPSRRASRPEQHDCSQTRPSRHGSGRREEYKLAKQTSMLSRNKSSKLSSRIFAVARRRSSRIHQCQPAPYSHFSPIPTVPSPKTISKLRQASLPWIQFAHRNGFTAAAAVRQFATPVAIRSRMPLPLMKSSRPSRNLVSLTLPSDGLKPMADHTYANLFAVLSLSTERMHL
jgi:hypothetical protein